MKGYDRKELKNTLFVKGQRSYLDEYDIPRSRIKFSSLELPPFLDDYSTQ